MRIITGRLKGRRLQGPSGPGLRPTSDSLRETLFNVLGDTVAGARVLDGFAGTGALGLEALSRNATHVTFVEHDPAALRVLEANVQHCSVETACAIIRGDFLRAEETASGTFDLVLLDPPYEDVDVEDALDRAAPLVAAGGQLVLEHSRRAVSPERAGGLRRTRLLIAGDSALSFYEPLAM